MVKLEVMKNRYFHTYSVNTMTNTHSCNRIIKKRKINTRTPHIEPHSLIWSPLWKKFLLKLINTIEPFQGHVRSALQLPFSEHESRSRVRPHSQTHCLRLTSHTSLQIYFVSDTAQFSCLILRIWKYSPGCCSFDSVLKSYRPEYSTYLNSCCQIIRIRPHKIVWPFRSMSPSTKSLSTTTLDPSRSLKDFMSSGRFAISEGAFLKCAHMHKERDDRGGGEVREW